MTCQFINRKNCQGSEEMAQLMALGADGIVTAAYGQFLPSKLLNSMDFAVNVHASLAKIPWWGHLFIMPLSMGMQKQV